MNFRRIDSLVGGRLRILLATIAMALCAGSAMAQETPPKFEIAGLYTMIPELFGPTCHGAAGSLSYNVNHWFSAVGEISGCSGTGPSGLFNTSPPTTHKWFTYLAGPRFSYRRKLTPYAHILFGGAHVSNDNSYSVIRGNAFAMTVGAGVDLKLSHRVALRLIQPEFLKTAYSNGIDREDLRIQTGVVFALK